MSPMLTDLKQSIDNLFAEHPLWCSSSSHHSILLLAAYVTGCRHATNEIATGGPTPDWHINDVSPDAAILLAYIRVEQLRIKRGISPIDPNASSVENKRLLSRTEDPELFDEFTGPHPAEDQDAFDHQFNSEEYDLPGDAD